jgi:hypothetical protein
MEKKKIKRVKRKVKSDVQMKTIPRHLGEYISDYLKS